MDLRANSIADIARSLALPPSRPHPCLSVPSALLKPFAIKVVVVAVQTEARGIGKRDIPESFVETTIKRERESFFILSLFHP